LNQYAAFENPADGGGYDITTLVPGDYFAVALDQEPADWQDPDILDAISTVDRAAHWRSTRYVVRRHA